MACTAGCYALSVLPAKNECSLLQTWYDDNAYCLLDD